MRGPVRLPISGCSLNFSRRQKRRRLTGVPLCCLRLTGPAVLGAIKTTQAACARLQKDLARYDLKLDNDELGAGLYYPHDLLWRIWREYPETAWAERAFVLLLDSGWDTSATCAKGSDQTKEVIRQGESFLQNRPSSTYRGVVTLLVAEAYASRWSLSNEPAGGEMFDYVNPKDFREGAEEARVKAISYFEKVVQLAPGTSLSRYALEVLPPLREKKILDNYRFYCVYD
jgi:hypothetical protein